MKRNNLLILFFLKVSISSLLCARPQQKVPRTIPTLQDNLDIELIKEKTPKRQHNYFLSLVGGYQHASGKVSQALETFQTLTTKAPPPSSYGGLINLLSDLGNFQTIVDLHKKNSSQFKKAFSDNIETQLMIAQAYANVNLNEQAEKMFIELAQKHPDNDQIAYFATLAYFKSGKFDKTEHFIKQCLHNQALKQRHFIFHFLYSKLLMQQQKFTLALEQIEKSLKLFPKFDRAMLVKAMLLEQMGKINDAINGYKNFLGLVGRDAIIEKQLVQLLFTQKRYSEAFVYSKRMNEKSPEYFFDLALMEFKKSNQKKALTLLDRAIKLGPEFIKARLLKAEILLQNKNFNELLVFMRDWIKQNYDNISVIHTLLLLRKAGLPVTNIIKTLLELENNKSHINLTAALADLYAENDNSEQARHYYNKVLESSQDATLKARALFNIGYLHFIGNQPQKLETTLEKAVAMQTVYPSSYNLLAYHYAHHNKKLTQALQLIEKALAVAPKCFYYLDTKGYVLLKMGKRAQALPLFQQALELAPDDTEIQKHLALAQENKP